MTSGTEALRRSRQVRRVGMMLSYTSPPFFLSWGWTATALYIPSIELVTTAFGMFPSIPVAPT